MKKLALLWLAVSALIFADCTNKTRDSITGVLEQRERVVRNWKAEPRGRTIPNLVNSLRRIDAKLCPNDFQIAWNDYLFELSETARISPGELIDSVAAGLTAEATGGISLISEGGKLAKESNDRQKKLREASHALKDVCLKYGVH